jgi:hypothetical protein
MVEDSTNGETEDSMAEGTGDSTTETADDQVAETADDQVAEKTAELRDIFLSVAEDGTVTETQEAGRGSLVRAGDVRERLQSVIETMVDDLEIDSPLSLEDLVTVVEGYYEGDSDTDIAERLGEDVHTTDVRGARLDLHLVTEADLEAPFSLERLQHLIEDDAPTSEIVADLDSCPTVVRHYTHVLEVQRERRRVADRYRERFEDVLQEHDIADRLTASLEETGLEEATEDQEVDVDM